MGRNADSDTAGSMVASVGQCVTPARLEVLQALRSGPRDIEGLRAATTLGRERLSTVLADLETRGLVEEQTTELEPLDTDYQCSQELTGTAPADAGRPVETEYTLTEKGASLEPVVEAVEAWADEWLEEPAG